MPPYIPQLVKYRNYKKPRSQTWNGSLYLKGTDGGLARKLSSQTISFTKTSTHCWSGWLWFDGDETRANTVSRVGTPNVNGYRIVKSKNGTRHTLALQEMKTYTSDTFVYPAGFDVTKPHYINMGFIGNSDTSATTWCYIDEREIRTKLASIDWSKAVAVNNPDIYIGSEYPPENFAGHINDIALFFKRPTVNEIFKTRWKRNFKDAVAYWRCDENGGNTIYDLVGNNNLTISSPGALKIANQSWPPLPGVGLDPTTLTLVDPNMSFNYGNNAQSGTGYYDEAETAAHLDFLWEIGCRKLRCPFAARDFADGVAVTRALMEQVVARGFDLIAVGQHRAATDANWSYVLEDVLFFADLAQQIGATEFQMFNELDYRETSGFITNSVPKQHAACQLVIDEGYVFDDYSVAIAQSAREYVGAPNGWIINGKGPFTKPGYNCYGDQGDFEQFKQRITDLRAAIPEIYISEWNIRGDNFNLFPTSEDEQNARIQEKLLWLMDNNLEHYFFTFYWPKQSDQYGFLKGNDQYRRWYEVLLKNR